jgi:hypothetical protein
MEEAVLCFEAQLFWNEVLLIMLDCRENITYCHSPSFISLDKIDLVFRANFDVSLERMKAMKEVELRPNIAARDANFEN